MIVCSLMLGATRLLALDAAPAAHTALAAIRAAHTLTCGVMKEEEDYSRAEDHGNRAAFDLDICKALAVATLGPGAHFDIKAYPDEPSGIKALLAGEIDIVASASPSVGNTGKGVQFSQPTFYDGQGLLFPNNAAVRTPADLADKKVCFLIGTQTETGLRTYAARHHISYIWYPFSEAGEMEAAFFTGNCAALTGDVSQLANTRAINRVRAHQFTILPELLRKDPLAVGYRGGDAQFAGIVHWTLEALIEAEELGVTQANAAGMLASTDPEVVQLLGQKFGTGALLGMDDHWGLNIIQAVGNYGEIFERDLGAGSPLHLDRGANRLWTAGGLMYANPPINF